MSKTEEVSAYVISIIVAGLFLGMGAIFWLAQKTFVSIDTLFVTGLLAGSTLSVIHYLALRRKKRYLGELLLISFAGWAPLILGLLLLVNFFFHGPEKKVFYHFQGKEAISVEIPLFPIRPPIKDERFKNYQYMLDFSEDELKTKSPFVTEAWFNIADGSLGYQILLNKELH